MRNPDYEGVRWYKQAKDSKNAASQVDYIFQNYYPGFLVSHLLYLLFSFRTLTSDTDLRIQNKRPDHLLPALLALPTEIYCRPQESACHLQGTREHDRYGGNSNKI